IVYGTVNGINHNIASTSGATGGTAPLVYSWYRSRTLFFTPGAGTLITGETAATLSVVAPDAEVWNYVRRVTDSFSPTPHTADSNICRAHRGKPTYRILEIGDSITEGGSPDIRTTV